MTSSFLNLKLYNVYFSQTTTTLIKRVDKKRDWQGSFTHEEAWDREGCDTQAFLSNARTHTQTNVLATEFCLTILFAFIYHEAKNTCRDHGRGTVDSSRTAEHAWTPRFCLTPVGIVTLLHYEWWKQRFSPWGIDRLTWRSDSLDDITSHRVLQRWHLHIKSFLPSVYSTLSRTPHTPFIRCPISQIVPNTLNHRLSPSSTSLQLLFIHVRPLVFPEH